MAALAASRDTQERAGIVIDFLVAAATKLYVGGLGALNAGGYAVPASDTAGLKVIGRIEGSPPPGITGQDVDNTSGANGDLKVNLKRGVFKFDNSGGDALGVGDVGKLCFAEDDHTVNKTGGANKIVAGTFLGLDSDGGAWVDTQIRRKVSYALTSAQNATAAAVDLATSEALANALKANYNQLQTDVAAILSQLS